MPQLKANEIDNNLYKNFFDSKRVQIAGIKAQWMRRVSHEVTLPEVILEEMAFGTVLKVTEEGGLEELYEETERYYNQIYMTIKREM